MLIARARKWESSVSPVSPFDDCFRICLTTRIEEIKLEKSKTKVKSTEEVR